MPTVLEAFGIEEGLQNLCKETQASTGITIVLKCADIPADLEKRTQIYLYRIVQEAIHNICKHSSATEACITLTYTDPLLKLNIEDNGIGFNAENINMNGNGLQNIKQRAELLHGETLIQSQPGRGTKIIINFKLV
jgi:signal transduction histidine kinase